jgi:hypothetical protein
MRYYAMTYWCLFVWYKELQYRGKDEVPEPLRKLLEGNSYATIYKTIKASDMFISYMITALRSKCTGTNKSRMTQ